MVELMLEIGIAKWKIEGLDDKIARRYRTEPVKSAEEKQLLANLAAAGSHILTGLGSALVSAGERLSGERTSGRAATV